MNTTTETLLALLQRREQRRRTIWRIVAAIGLILLPATISTLAAVGWIERYHTDTQETDR
jgi:hypothetical protein